MAGPFEHWDAAVMKRRWWISLVLLPVALIGLVGVLAHFVNATEAGSRWLVDRAIKGAGGELKIDTVKGSLESGLRLSGVRFEDDGLTIGLESLRVVADLTLLPPRVEIRSLHADSLKVQRHMADTSPGEPPLSLEDVIATLRPPVFVEMGAAVISDFQLSGPDGEPVLQLDQVHLVGRWKDALEWDRFEVSAPGLWVSSNGHIDLIAPHMHQLAMQGSLAETWQQGGVNPALEIGLELAGDAEVTRLELRNESVGLKLSGSVESPFSDAYFKLRVQADQFFWNGEGVPDAFQLEELSGQLEGRAADYRISLGVFLEAAGLERMQLELGGRGGGDSFDIDYLAVSAENLQAKAAGHIQWAADRALYLDLDVQRAVPQVGGVAWPREHFVEGRASLLATDDAVNISNLVLHLAGTEMEISGNMLWDPGAGVVDADLQWEKLGWPLGVETYQWSSRSGSMQVLGSPADWLFEGRLDFETALYPGGGFVLQGGGRTGSADIQILEGQVLGGSLNGNAQLDWHSTMKWSANLDLAQVNLGELFDEWPARLDANLGISRDMGSDVLKLDFTSFNGEFEGQEFSGSGGLVLQGSEIRFSGIQLHSAGSELAINGGLREPGGLEFEFDVRQPGWMSEYLGGEIKGSGRFAPAAEHPLLDVQLEGRDLQWGGLLIQGLAVEPVRNLPAGEAGLLLTASGVETGVGAAADLKALITGNKDSQSLNIQVDRAGSSLVAHLEGAVADWTRLAEDGWSGQLAALSVESGNTVLLDLDAVVPLDISSSAIRLGQTCLSVTGAGGLCVESSWARGDMLEVSASLSNLGLSTSRLFIDHELEFTQTLDGTFNWTRKAGAYPSGSAQVRLSPGGFGDGEGELGHIQTGEGFFGFTMTNGNLVDGELDIPFPGVGHVDADYTVSGLALDGTGEIEARVDITLNDASMLETLAGGLEEVSGQLDIDLKVTGSTSDPRLDGLVSLRDGAADIAILGTQLRQIDMEGTFRSNDKAQLQGRFQAGDGSGKFNVDAEFSDWTQPVVKLDLNGSSLRLLNTPNLRLDTGADLHLAWAAGEWLVDGAILIDDAQLMPVASFIGKVNESEDVRVVAGARPFGQVKKAVSPVKVDGTLEVTLGENVEIRTEQARLALGGALSLTWNGNLVPVANGSIHADGTLSLFGPQLHVSGGRVRFPGVPVDDPVLDIKAERDIYGNTQIRSAGVSIMGSAHRPEVEAYTNPYTTKDRAWALLITGSDVEYGQGVGAFEVGAYIAPRVYLSYGVSLFDDDNVVNARYDLKKGFGIKASSGQRDSGVDVSYTVDR